MAQMIYREWFVNFRFPGHENVRMVDSELGPIPEGWEIETLGEIAQITMGQSPPSNSYNSVGSGLPFHQGVTDFGTRVPNGPHLLQHREPIGRGSGHTHERSRAGR